MVISGVIFRLPLFFLVSVKKNSIFALYFSLVCVVAIAGVWWRDVVRERTYQGHHTAAVVAGLRLGMLLFILREVMLFFRLFWAYFHAALGPTPAIGCA